MSLPAEASAGIPRWSVFEAAVAAATDHGTRSTNLRVTAEFTGPEQRRRVVDAFWDGGRTWRVRFCPDAPGRWSFRIASEADAGLNGASGEFECVPYTGDNPIYLHGPIGLAADRLSFAHADGTPFLWLGDTAWNGVLKADRGDWQHYLKARRRQGFTVVQHLLTQFRAFRRDSCGEAAYFGEKDITINPGWFQRIDAKVVAINAAGMVSAAVLLWAIKGEDNPGYTLSDGDAVLLARYMVARYGAYSVAWLLGGDGSYLGANAERWRRIGNAIFGDRHDRPVTMHPAGMHWVADEFRDQAWFDFIAYQSGHGDDDETVRWLVQGPPAQEWPKPPPRPIVNLEPNYETHVSYQSRQRFTPRHVRRALYWSLLVSPPAGVTYGHHGIWPWMLERGLPPDHPYTGEAEPWYTALEAEGAQSVAYLRAFFTAFPWWRLRPAQDLLAVQPGDADPNRFVAVARDGLERVVAYLPFGGEIAFRAGACPLGRVTWFSPRTGAVEAREDRDEVGSLTAPDENDWVLLLEPCRHE
ncbi:MAG: apiosidase-like domain-containing protein [Anaerolineae bacterium]